MQPFNLQPLSCGSLWQGSRMRFWRDLGPFLCYWPDMQDQTDNNSAPGVKAGFSLASLPQEGRLLGVDLGSRTMGLAISDSLRLTATPLMTIRRSKFTADASQMIDVIEQNQVGGIVLGLPLNMDGTEGPRAQSTRAFARNFSKLSPIPIAFWDERLSTSAVTRTLIEADMSRSRRAQVVDKLAASFILQGALDNMGT